jgi:hypothetical protein
MMETGDTADYTPRPALHADFIDGGVYDLATGPTNVNEDLADMNARTPYDPRQDADLHLPASSPDEPPAEPSGWDEPLAPEIAQLIERMFAEDGSAADLPDSRPVEAARPASPIRELETPETISATSVGNPDETFELTIHKTETIHMGVEEKQIVHGEVNGEPTTLMERRPRTTNPDKLEEQLQHDAGLWKACKEAGLTVAPNAYVSDRGTMLVTDVKADGSEVYGKRMGEVLNGYNPEADRSRPHKEIDGWFMQLTSPENLPAIKERARRQSALATANGIELPFDEAYELIVHPDGSWDVITLDFTDGTKLSPDTTGFARDVHMPRTNEEGVAMLMTSIDKIRTGMQKIAGWGYYDQT